MPVSSLPAILFDLDGTLADTLPDIAATTSHVREAHDLPAVDLQTVRSYIGDGARMLLQRALAERKPDAAMLDAAFRTYVEHHEAQCTVGTQLFPGVHEHLVALREAGHGIAIVTNKPERFALPVARFLGLDAFTDVIVGGDTLPTKKPDPAMLQHALDRLGAPRDGATMVGDGLQDLRSGRRLGVRTIACLFGYGDREALLEEGADVFWEAFAKPARG